MNTTRAATALTIHLPPIGTHIYCTITFPTSFYYSKYDYKEQQEIQGNDCLPYSLYKAILVSSYVRHVKGPYAL